MSARTEVGIVEWAWRARAAELTGRAVADVLGRAVQATDVPDVRARLLDRARRHGWCADQWSTVVPVLHDVDLSTVSPIDAPPLHAVLDDPALRDDAHGILAAEALASSALAGMWVEWVSEAGPVADAPFLFVLERTLHELGASAPH